MKLRIFVGLMLLVLFVSACDSAASGDQPDPAPTNPPTAQPTQQPDSPTEAVVEEPTVIVLEVEATATEAPTETVPEPTSAPATAVIVEGSLPALMTYSGCDGESNEFASWCLMYGDTVTDIPVTELPANSRAFPVVYDFAEVNNRLLLGLSDWDGAGPANFSATDLWLGSNPEKLSLTPLIYNSTVVNAQLSTDGQLIAYLSATDRSYDLRLLNLNTASDEVIASDVTPDFIFSPDSTKIAFVRDSEWIGTGDDFGLYIISLDSLSESRVPIDLLDVYEFYTPSYWSEDGQTIVVQVRFVNDEINTWKYMVYNLADGSSSEIVFDSAAVGLYAFDMVDPDNVTPQIWAEDGSSFLATVATGIMTSEFTFWVLQYNLDPALGVIMSIDVVAEHAELMGWDLPGESVWVFPTEKNEAGLPYSVELP